ncbi:MAG: DUF3313 family protein [Planctomycetota bacterium]
MKTRQSQVRAIVSGLTAAAIVTLIAGCAQDRAEQRVGFLSDYDKLEKVSPDVARYTANLDAFRGFNSIYVAPVEVVPLPGSKLEGTDESLQAGMARTLRYELQESLDDHYYPQADVPGAGVATLRVALTEVDPQSGRVSLEGELIDSISGDQLMAGVASRTWWGSVDRTMDRWSDLFVGRLDAVAPRPPQPAGDLPAQTGFLSTYSNLGQAGPASLRYIEPNNRLAQYSKFIVLPVEARLYDSQDVSAEEVEQLEGMMEQALKDALAAEYEVVETPGIDVAEVRVALTNITKSTPVLNAVPRLKVADFGLGGMSMEGEVLDSYSGVQIAALVESATGRNLSWNPSELDDAEGVMQDLANRLVSAIELSHARAGN